MKQQSFIRAQNWISRAKIQFEDERLQDFAARLILRHASEQELVTELGQNHYNALESACSMAFERMYSTDDNAHWMTIKKGVEDADENNDQAFKEWLQQSLNFSDETDPIP